MSFDRLGSLDIIPGGETPQDPAHAPVYEVIAAVEGLNYAQHIVASPDGATLYVARGWLGDVAAFDLASGELTWRLQTTSFRADHTRSRIPRACRCCRRSRSPRGSGRS